MRFFLKFAASAVGAVCTTASACWLLDEKRRLGVVFAATVLQTPNESPFDGIALDSKGLSQPIRSSEVWNWNWDG